jgi:hypothetical protein
LLKECAREWRADGRPADLDALTRAASQIPGQRALIDIRGGTGVKSFGDPSHGEAVEAVGVENPDRRVNDRLAVQRIAPHDGASRRHAVPRR